MAQGATAVGDLGGRISSRYLGFFLVMCGIGDRHACIHGFLSRQDLIIDKTNEYHQPVGPYLLSYFCPFAV